METATKKRSMALTPDQWDALRAYREGYSTSVACAVSLGLDRNTLDRVLQLGSGAPDTIEKISETLGFKKEDSEKKELVEATK